MDPLHITEFASERYFEKLKQLNSNEDNASSSTQPAAAAATPLPPPPSLTPTFTLPLRNPRHRPAEEEEHAHLKPSEQKKRSLGHDLTSLRTQRRPSFTGSFGRLHSKVSVIHKTPTIVEHREYILAEEAGASHSLSLADLFHALPIELQEHIIAPLPIHDILNLRLVSKSFHTSVALNENPIARYHIAHSLPSFTLKLYPLPPPAEVNLHCLCSIWHRLHVASKLSIMIARYAVKDIFLRNTPATLAEFEPQHRRMRKRLLPLVFTLFHFFETYRGLHVKHLMEGRTPLNRQAFTLNPLEVQVMNMYDDHTLLKAHQVWTLTISSFNRRLRPPSYAGRLERSLKGYLKDRPADEVYTTILAVGGLRQAQRFWETKGYNARRAGVDTWYGFVTKTPVETPPKSKMSQMSRITHLGRKKTAPAPEASTAEAAAHHDATSCNEWFCVKPSCQAARRRHSTDNLVFHSSLAAGPPMSPLSRSQLSALLPDLQHLSNIWVHTAEALIIERKIVEAPKDIKKITQVLLELIKDDGTDNIDEWSSGNPRTAHMEPLERTNSGEISD